MNRDAIKIGLLGLGTVGTGVMRVLHDNAADIARKVGVPLRVEKILVRDAAKARTLAVDKSLLTTKAADILANPEIDLVIELMGGEHPAKDYILTAMKQGKHVVTANKDVVAKHGKELFDTAAASRVDFQFEASVGGGIPIIRPLKQCLAGNKIQEIIGIVNGTTNYMLTKMSQEGCDFHAVLQEAQEKGYAEADPTADVGGLDAARKIAILASIAFSSRIGVDDVYVEGITQITPGDIAYARELGYVIKLLGIAKEVDGQVEVRVHPAFIPQTHPLASVNDVFNAIFVKGDAVGETMFYGRGAGELPTASAVVADVIDVARDIVHNISSRILCTCFNNKPLRSMEEVPSSFYVRLIALDKPGVLATIAGAFGSQGVGLQSVIQKRKVDCNAEVVLVTDKVAEKHVRNALRVLEADDVVREIGNVIRVEGGNLS
ncbi:MAG TPA: homoserine dehydrogenase [Firmicutes bacterium]|nr:homoserine dehydrogenase [Bacillota bacterium]